MASIVGIRLSPPGRVLYFDAGDLDLSTGDRVVVDTESGPREGRVVFTPHQVLQSDLRGPLAPVLRKADPE